MKFSITTLVATLAAIASALPSDNYTADLHSREIPAGVSWTGELGGKTVTLTGTVEEIRAQIEAESPDFFAQQANTTDVESRDIEKRWVVKEPTYCGYGEWMSRAKALDGINYLKTSQGGKMWCSVPMGHRGKGGCSRVSCTQYASIWVCNDGPKPLGLPCSTFASAALELSHRCYWVQEGGFTMTRGQLFVTEGWNVILTADNC